MRNQRHERTWSASSEDVRPAATPGAVQVGARVGPYVVEALLGEGGAARVWRVRHVELGVERALKILKRGSAAGSVRMAREARLQAEIDHAHVVRVHDVLDVLGQPGLVMALAHGGSLSDAVARGSIDSTRAVRIGRDLARGLSAIHALGVVHRDVKPSNILLMGPDERAALTDFGIAREDGSDATRTGDVLGTPAYMAPEQLRSTATVGPAADMYAFGVVLYELLVGARPSQSLAQVADGLATQRPAVAALVLDCLNPEPAARPAAAQALVRLADPPTARRPRLALWLGLVGALCAAGAWFGLRERPAEDPPAPVTVEAEAPLRRAFERLGTDPGEAAALWRASQDAPDARPLERALWDAGGDVRVIPTQAEIVDLFTTPDGARLVGLTTAGWVHVWDRATGERIFAMDSAAGVPMTAHLSADGRLIAVVPHSARSTAGARSQVRVLDLSTGKVVFTASNGDTTGSTYFGFSPDGARAFTYSNARTMTVWDVRSGAQVGRLDLGATTCSEGAAFGPDGRRLAVLGIDGVLRRYDANLELIAESPVIHGHPMCVMRWTADRGIVVSAGGTMVRVAGATGEVLATASGIGRDFEFGRDRVVTYGRAKVQILDADTLAVEKVLAHPKGVLDVALDASGEQIATASVDGVVRVWSTRTGRLLRALVGHRSWVHALAGATAGDWSLWSAGRDRTLRGWRLPAPDGPLFDFQIQSLRMAAENRLVLGRAADRVAVHALATRETVLDLPLEGAALRAFEASPDGRALIERAGKRLVLHPLNGTGTGTGRPLPIGGGFDHWVFDGQPPRFVVANTRLLRRVDVTADGVSEVRWTLERNPSHVGQSRDRRWIFMTSFDTTLTVWPVGAEETPPRVLEMGCAQPSFVEPSGPSSVIIGDWSGCLERWDLATGVRTAKWRGHTDAIARIDAGPGQPVSSALDGTLRVWGPEGQGRVFGRHAGGAFGFTRAGDRVVSIGADRTIRRWSLSTDQPGPIRYLPSRPKGIWGDADGTVRVADEDGLVWSFAATPAPLWGNLRVCRGTLDVVPVLPFPASLDPWAPEDRCAR